MLNALPDALNLVFQPNVLAVIAVAAVYGAFIGATRGLTATVAVALLAPIAIFLDPISAVAALVTTATCGTFAGKLPRASHRIPGRHTSAADAPDALAVARAPCQEACLGTGLIFSVAGGLLGVLALVVALVAVAPKLALLNLTHHDYFWLCVLALSCAAIVSRDSRLKGLFGVSLGLLISTVGTGGDHTVARFAFHPALTQGVSFLPAVVGLLGMAAILRNMVYLRADERNLDQRGPPAAGGRSAERPGDLDRPLRRPLLAAAGSTALAGAWAPALAFGIPGDAVTAVALSILLMKNIEPVPEIFLKQPMFVSSVFVVFALANLLLLPVGWAAMRGGSLIACLPRRVLMPVILLFCIVGAYSVSGDLFDVWIMLALGILGFVLDAWGVPLGAVVLGIFLGGRLEHHLIECLTASEGRWWALFAQPVSAMLAVACAALWLGPTITWLTRRMVNRRRRHRRARPADRNLVVTAETI